MPQRLKIGNSTDLFSCVLNRQGLLNALFPQNTAWVIQLTMVFSPSKWHQNWPKKTSMSQQTESQEQFVFVHMAVFYFLWGISQTLCSTEAMSMTCNGGHSHVCGPTAIYRLFMFIRILLLAYLDTHYNFLNMQIKQFEKSQAQGLRW